MLKYIALKHAELVPEFDVHKPMQETLYH